MTLTLTKSNYNKDIEEERNIIMNIKRSENRKILNNGLKDFNNSVECQNYNEYEREQELLRIIFNISNIIYND